MLRFARSPLLVVGVPLLLSRSQARADAADEQREGTWTWSSLVGFDKRKPGPRIDYAVGADGELDDDILCEDNRCISNNICITNNAHPDAVKIWPRSALDALARVAERCAELTYRTRSSISAEMRNLEAAYLDRKSLQ